MIEGRERRRRLRAGIARLADPKITLASVASMLVGACAAAAGGPLSWGWLAVTVLGIFCVEAAKNASGEIFDFDSGTDQAVADEDRSPFSGGKRVLVERILTKTETAAIAGVFYALGIAAGLVVAFGRERAVLWFGAAGVALAYGYHAPPAKLSYRGLGEAAVALTYGPLIACGTFLVQRHAVSSGVVLASLPIGLLIGAFLLANEFPDRKADAVAGKRTLVVRLGPRAASRLFAGVVAAAFATLAALPAAGLPAGVWLGAIGLPTGVAAARQVVRSPEITSGIVPAQASMLVTFLLAAAGIGAGLLL